MKSGGTKCTMRICTQYQYYAEKVPADEISLDDGSVFYLPHHGVYNPAKPDRIRIVMDASAKCDGVCLNNQCYQGP